MPLMTAITGLLLIILGLGSYVESASGSKTALIPAAFGAVFAVLGVVAMLSEPARKHAMHGAAALALIGAALPAGRIAMNFGQFNIYSLKDFTLFLMTVICLALLAMCVNSFVQARMARKDEPVAAPPPVV